MPSQVEIDFESLYLQHITIKIPWIISPLFVLVFIIS